MFNTRFIIKPL